MSEMLFLAVRGIGYLCHRMSADLGFISLYFLQFRANRPELADPETGDWAHLEERETAELTSFLRAVMKELRRRSIMVPPETLLTDKVHITRDLRIFIGNKELKIRPMAKTILLLFIGHPEGITLKRIADYKPELMYYYRRLMRSQEPVEAEKRVECLIDIFNNSLNVNIARVNTAISALVSENTRKFYQIQGSAGQAKSILLDRSWVQWDR